MQGARSGAAAHLHRKEPVELVFGRLVAVPPWGPCKGAVPGTARGRPRTMEGLAWERLGHFASL